MIYGVKLVCVVRNAPKETWTWCVYKHEWDTHTHTSTGRKQGHRTGEEIGPPEVLSVAASSVSFGLEIHFTHIGQG